MIIYIDNTKIEAKAGQTVIQAAADNGIDIPHFCWHPELSIAGNCRMCLVEIGTPKRNPDGSIAMDESQQPVINYMPKLQVACNSAVSDGMHVKTNTAKVSKARAAVMEFMLINHPLDCPICDEAGACKLQHYSVMFSCQGSRFTEKKNANPKRVPWNDKIIYDAERCISCGRCIRFTNEIMKEDTLTLANRGDKVTIQRFHDKPIENDYSMNVIDNCPVGALTSASFRFKARAWEMSFNDSICTVCGKGCNITVGVRNNEVLKVAPRYNPAVNGHWICDAGRLEYPSKINNNRLTHPQVKKETRQNATWDEAIKSTVKILKQTPADELFVLVSGTAANEAIYLFAELATKQLQTKNIGYIKRSEPSFADNRLKHASKMPNENGLKACNIQPVNVNNLIEQISTGKIKTLLTVEEDFSFAPELADVFAKLKSLIVLVPNQNSSLIFADIIMPLATPPEYAGSFTNVDNIVQHFKPFIIVGDNISPLDAVQIGLNRSRLDVFGEQNDKWNQKPNMDIKPAWWIAKELQRALTDGQSEDYQTAADVTKHFPLGNSGR